MIRCAAGGVASPPVPLAIVSFQPALFTAVTTASTVASPGVPTDNMPPFVVPNVPELTVKVRFLSLRVIEILFPAVNWIVFPSLIVASVLSLSVLMLKDDIFFAISLSLVLTS